jgi:hypothetical protein
LGGSRAAGAVRLGDPEEGLLADPEDLVSVFPRGRKNALEDYISI